VPDCDVAGKPIASHRATPARPWAARRERVEVPTTCRVVTSTDADRAAGSRGYAGRVLTPADEQAAEGRQTGRLGRPLSDCAQLGGDLRRACRAGWHLGHQEHAANRATTRRRRRARLRHENDVERCSGPGGSSRGSTPVHSGGLPAGPQCAGSRRHARWKSARDVGGHLSRVSPARRAKLGVGSRPALRGLELREWEGAGLSGPQDAEDPDRWASPARVGHDRHPLE
jgi:hypothetical protein